MARLNDNFTLRAPVPVDDRKGYWDGSAWQPFDSVQDALDKTPYYRYRTLTLPVVEDGEVVEYWFRDGIENADFVLKTSQADLSNYYTKTELQTSGSAQVHWGNITNIPDLSVTWENISGDQSVIGNAGFTNNAGYITLAQVPSQVQSDWNATSGLAEILNKPTLATVATSGDYDDLINKPSIPDLTGYATEQWVEDQNYLTSVSSSWNVNNGNLIIQGQTRNLDGRYMLRSNTITSGYGITASSDFTTPVNIEVNTSVLDNRYLRKNVNDSNGAFSLTLGGLSTGTLSVDSTVSFDSLDEGLITDQMVVRDSSTGEIKYINMPSFGGAFNVANSSGTTQFSVDTGQSIRFAAGSDGSVAFNPTTRTITYNFTGGGGSSGIQSVFGRTDANIIAEAGDYNTDLVTELSGATNLYFTQGRVRSTPLTGFSATNSSITATDNILQAFGKAQGQINARVPTSRDITISGTSGNITVGGGNTQDLTSDPSWTINLATVGTAGANKTKVTTDAYGRVIGSADLTMDDLPSGVVQTLSKTNVLTSSVPYRINISGGNYVDIDYIASSLRNGSVINEVPYGQSGLSAWRTSATNDAGYSVTATGLRVLRQSTADASFGFDVGMSFNQQQLYYRPFSGSTWSGIKFLATTDDIPTNYVTTNTTQTGLSGDKTWTGYHTFNNSITTYGITVDPMTTGGWARRMAFLSANGSTSISFGGYGGDSSINYAYIGANYNDATIKVIGNSVSINQTGTASPIFDGLTIYSGASGGINLSSTAGGIYVGGDRVLAVGTNTILSGPAAGSSVYLRPNGTGSTTGQAIFSPSSVTLYALTGTGTQMVVANASGVLSRQAIPSGGGGTVTQVNTGSHLTGTITTTGTIGMAFSRGVWVTDNGSNNRLYFGTTASNDIIIEGSVTNGLFSIRNSSNSNTFQINTSTGAISMGTIPWGQVTGKPTTFYTLPAATATARGGIELFSNTVQSVAANAVTATASRTYGIQVNSAGQAVVNVPWTNTNTTYTGNTGITLATGNVFQLTNIAAGSATVGTIRYNGTTASAGRLYGGTTAPSSTTRLNYNGILHAYDFIGYGSSDRRLKEEIVRISNPLEKLSQIGGYGFKWKEGNDNYSGYDYGVIAQEVEKILPEIVVERGGVKAIKTGNQLTGLLIEGMKELMSINKKLTERVEALECGLS